MAKWIAANGDDIPSIADSTGFFWETLWDHPENADLKEKRKNPNVIYPGDEVFVPDIELKYESRETEQRHRFVRLGVPAKIVMKLMADGEPRANVDYVLEVEDVTISGKTSSDGEIEAEVPPKAKQGKLILNGGDEEYMVSIGALDPIDEIIGVQERLSNLGYDCYPFTNRLDGKTQRALLNFQADHNLESTGRPDKATRDKLLEVTQ